MSSEASRQQHRDNHRSSPPTSTPTPTRTKTGRLALLAILTAILAVLIALFYSDSDNLFCLRSLFGPSSFIARSVGGGISKPSSTSAFASAGTAAAATIATTAGAAASTPKGPVHSQQSEGSSSKMNNKKTPVYFLSHGGPSIMYDTEHPAYFKLAEIGREITHKVKPRAVVVFSAHWQGGRDTIYVNTAEMTDLIYDFYGFPDHYYKEKYPNVGSKEVSQKVLDSLAQAGIKAKGVKRGLDHGVWASFKCAFEPDSNPLTVPVVQVSLFDTEDPSQHYRLGQAISHLRDENILVIVSGMAVHNLRDMRFTFGNPRPLPYAVSFDDALNEAVTTSPAEREKAMAALLKRPDARQAHPSFEHLLPIHVGAGAAGMDLGKRLWTFPEGSMSWAQFRFGEVGGASGADSSL